MVGLIKNDIEKIERALNIRLDDPGIELTWNTGNHPPIPGMEFHLHF